MEEGREKLKLRKLKAETRVAGGWSLGLKAGMEILFEAEEAEGTQVEPDLAGGGFEFTDEFNFGAGDEFERLDGSHLGSAPAPGARSGAPARSGMTAALRRPE
jgi:hypothetical protein